MLPWGSPSGHARTCQWPSGVPGALCHCPAALHDVGHCPAAAMRLAEYLVDGRAAYSWAALVSTSGRGAQDTLAPHRAPGLPPLLM